MCFHGRNASKMQGVRQAGQSTADAHRDLLFLSHSSLISGEIFLYLPEPTKICHFFPQGQQPKHPKPVAGHVRSLETPDPPKAPGALHPLVFLKLGGKCLSCGEGWRNGTRDLFPVVVVPLFSLGRAGGKPGHCLPPGVFEPQCL